MISFYNLENLFDTIDDPKVMDDDFTPGGDYHWDSTRYEEKILRLAQAIRDIGSKTGYGPPDILGVCEAENYRVLSDLVSHELLRTFDYGIIHRDGPDERGIDVALLYRKASFSPVSMKWHPLLIRNEERFREFTRDQLVVHGYMDGLPIYLLVNHWPSRRGGEMRSRPYRIAAAELNLEIMDSIRTISPEPIFIAMGDFNDNPTDYTFRKVLRVKKDSDSIQSGDLYNPMTVLFRKGMGSLAYRDSWSLFDQIYMSGNLAKPESPLRFWKAGIHNPDFLTQRRGRFKGYPFRSFTSGNYTGGYSDHFPVYALFVKQVKVLFRDD
ncbi:endonuclease/exonuclease/phosphatase family protein [Muriicola marianensis]|uniref:Endonuclease n=1 Tax=Muriicola marianensis TaxID=1324801 RepID=A0ABQ1R1V7_9FLAO|nr:endonuclease/exonuclease/phosphatase family protein [Muriicola marianensis]GGD51780.1 endonuclease [Muriicola marianensis]